MLRNGEWRKSVEGYMHALRMGGQSWCGGYHVHATVKTNKVTCPDCLAAQRRPA